MGQKTIGDGTGTDSTPEGQGLTNFENAKPENPAAPWDSNRGGRGPEVQKSATTPKPRGD
jgi:hypothetical protein